MDLRLTGKVALVTGGSRGLGYQMVKAFAQHGADVFITSRKQEACAKVAAEVRTMGRKAVAHACNVANWNELEGLVEAAYRAFGRIDILVNNAGSSPLAPSSLETPEALFDRIVSLNFKGPFRLTSLVGSRMAAGDGGSIINVSSIASQRPSPTEAPYGAAKAGVNSLTQSFAAAFGPKVRSFGSAGQWPTWLPGMGRGGTFRCGIGCWAMAWWASTRMSMTGRW